MSAGFALRMAWRQTRGAWRHFVGFGACVALGVAALVAVGTLAVNLDGALTREARTLLGGDVELRAARPLGADAAAALERLRRAGARTTALRELVGMARSPAGRTLPVEVKAVDPAYPLYGRVQTRPAAPLAGLLAPRDGVPRQLIGELPREICDVVPVIAVLGDRRPIADGDDRRPEVIDLGPRVVEVVLARHALATGLEDAAQQVAHERPASVAHRQWPGRIRRYELHVDRAARTGRRPAPVGRSREGSGEDPLERLIRDVQVDEARAGHFHLFYIFIRVEP